MDERINILNLSLDELTEWMSRDGEPGYRAGQVFEWIYQKGVCEFDRMTNLSLALRRKLADSFIVSLPAERSVQTSEDGTEKILLEVGTARRAASTDGRRARIETVLMPADDRTTQCLSSQAGCALDCRFCATATMGFSRNLTTAEMIGQVMLGIKRTADSGRRLTNFVFMGMGEPLLNFDHLCKTIELMTSPKALGFSPSRITVSTAGVADKLKTLAQSFKVNIAISLNASTDQQRQELMPAINRKYGFEPLLKTAREIARGRRKALMFEYILMAGVNDSESDARRLVKLLGATRCKLNLIPYNGFPGSGFQRPSAQSILRFQEYLHSCGLPAFIRWSQGEDISAACGQLAVNR